MFKKEDEKDRGRLDTQHPIATPTLARPMRRSSRRRSFEAEIKAFLHKCN